MPDILRMPEVAANTPEVVLATWNAEVNAPYSAGDTIVTVETEKAVIDVEAEADGVLLRLLVDEGTNVEVGTPIAVWGSVGDTDAEAEVLLATLGLSSVAEGVPHQPTADEARSPASMVSTTAPLVIADGERLFASPLARRMARDLGVDLASLVGTGPGGRIRRRDVDAAVAAGASRPTRTSGEALRPVPTVEAPVAGVGYEDVPNTRIRQAIARRLTESKQTTPHFYLRGSARVDRLLALRKEINEGGKVRVSVNDMLVKAVARAHTLVPGLNVQWNVDSIRHFSGVDIAVAVATDTGLVTPVVRGVDSMPVGQLAESTRDLVTRAKQRRLQQCELEGGSITVTNLGMYGTEEFAAIINPPQAAIVAVGAVRQEPVVQDGQLAVAAVLRVTLAVDHRPVDGATAAEWMKAIVDLLEHPLQIVL
ncbi:dihydrolipoamide acetyltransferase family protein [Streptomyces sp. NPDC050743]|uniref:dihydrolipoamide acetyltransferase family protein n=1 Tax=Streptomyces sp. NPDC050743 TaxID=3365634 RepID=UPI0037AB3616